MRDKGMLLSLNIKNYAIIDSLNIDFQTGLNVLTGETGAGKSILVGALSLALGYRANTDSIRSGKEKLFVQALFSFEKNDSDLLNLMEEYRIENEDNTLLLSRELNANGRSVCRINDTLVNVGTLKSFASQLVDIHGQHEHQKLLSAETHIDFLDAYGGENLSSYKMQTENLFRLMMQKKKEYEDLLDASKYLKDKQDLYAAQYEEINSLGLQPGEDDALSQRKNKLANSEKLFEHVNLAYGLLYDNEENALNFLHQIETALNHISEIDPQTAQQHADFEDSMIRMEEIAYGLRDYLNELEFNPEELDNIQSRLHQINQLKRKYGETIEEILSEADLLQEKLSLITNSELNVSKAEEAYHAAEKEYLESAKRLSSERKKTAERLSVRMLQNFHELAMEHSEFEVEFTEGNYTAKGTDRVEFYISTNVGQEKKPLAKIASGGEISRVMLAIKSILADADATGTLIFDEIDTGISGRTAQTVAEKMASLRKNHQILCITHLPQIASMADAHYLISKYVETGNTFTEFKLLAPNERVTELARMLGGVHVTQTTQEHASEMLRLSEEYKQNFAE
jgi:DNA repair protein RecN (Recombination protein N)